MKFPNYKVLKLGQADTYSLVLPEGFYLSSDSLEGLREVVARDVAENRETIYCAAGHTNFPFGYIPTSLASRVNSWTGLERTSRESVGVGALEFGPVLVRTELLSGLDLGGDDLVEIFDYLNSQISIGSVTARVIGGLACFYDGVAPTIEKGRRAAPAKFSVRSDKPEIAIITRTLGKRPDLLHRNVNSVEKLKERAKNFTVSHHIYTSNVEIGSIPGIPENRVHLVDAKDKADSRFALLREAIERNDAEFFWIVDDDDFINSEIAGDLNSLFSNDSEFGLLFLDSIHFHESAKARRPRLGNRYSALQAMESFMGPNQTPICSVIYPGTKIPLGMLDNGSKLAVLEDHYLLMQALLHVDCSPTYISSVGAFISIRGDGQSVVGGPRNVWSSANADLAHLMSLAGGGNAELLQSVARLLRERGKTSTFRTLLKLAAFVVQPGFWRALRDFDFLARFRAKKFNLRTIFDLARRSRF